MWTFPPTSEEKFLPLPHTHLRSSQILYPLPGPELSSGLATPQILMNSQRAAINNEWPTQLLTALYIIGLYGSVPTLAFGVPLPVLRSLICLFIYSGTYSFSPLRACCQSKSGREGKERKWVDWGRNLSKTEEMVSKWASGSSCIWWSICFCLFAQTLVYEHDCQSCFHSVCKHALISIKKVHSWPNRSHIQLVKGCMYSHVLKHSSTLHGERRAERQIILIESGWDENQVHLALSRDLRSRHVAVCTSKSSILSQDLI